MSNGTSLARNSKQDLASIPMAQRGLSRLAIARLKSARVPVAPLLKRVGLTLTRTCVTRLGLLPSLKVKVSALPMKLVAPVIITKRSPPSCARIAFAKSGQSFLRFLIGPRVGRAISRSRSNQGATSSPDELSSRW
jgi:hypothetical protein